MRVLFECQDFFHAPSIRGRNRVGKVAEPLVQPEHGAGVQPQDNLRLDGYTDTLAVHDGDGQQTGSDQHPRREGDRESLGGERTTGGSRQVARRLEVDRRGLLK